MHFRNNNNYKYIYLWNDEDLVVLVEGNNDKAKPAAGFSHWALKPFF